jgi:hypothetical protein
MDADQEEEFMRSVGLGIKKSLGAGIAGMFASSKTDDTNLIAELEAKDLQITSIKANAMKLADGYKTLLLETLEKQRLERETSQL